MQADLSPQNFPEPSDLDSYGHNNTSVSDIVAQCL